MQSNLVDTPNDTTTTQCRHLRIKGSLPKRVQEENKGAVALDPCTFGYIHADSVISVVRVVDIDEVQVVAAVSFNMRQRWGELRAVVGPRVKDQKSSVLQLDQRSHHEREGIECRPRTDVLWTVVHVHLRRVDLKRQLANTLDKSRRHEVV